MINYINNKIWLLIIIYSFFLFNCSNNNISGAKTSDENTNLSNEGLSIYVTKVEINSNLAYQNFNLESANLIGEPIISYNQILSYDTSNHIITLSNSRDSLKNKIGQISIYGEPFIVTVDSQKIYGGWFWSPVSSIPCHSAVIILDGIIDSLKSNEIKIKLGYPNENQFKGIDYRNNKLIIDCLIRDNKIK